MFQQFYDGGAEGYDRLFGRVPLHFSASLLRAARLKPGQNVLDVATGTGIVAEAIAHAIGPSGSLIGVDISRAMMSQAERRLSGMPHVSLEAGDCQALRFEDQQFDVVICSLCTDAFFRPGARCS